MRHRKSRAKKVRWSGWEISTQNTSFSVGNRRGDRASSPLWKKKRALTRGKKEGQASYMAGEGSPKRKAHREKMSTENIFKQMFS